jgi:formate dehydrogenase assembly factor FdhD
MKPKYLQENVMKPTPSICTRSICKRYRKPKYLQENVSKIQHKKQTPTRTHNEACQAQPKYLLENVSKTQHTHKNTHTCAFRASVSTYN